jgi:NTP pyrophosphatase (non-canonical NTP hydrolase)
LETRGSSDVTDTIKMYIGGVRAGLQSLEAIQSIVSKPVFDAGHDQIGTYLMALMVEVAELANELDWKPWKKDQEVDAARVRDEFADILAFTGVLVYLLNKKYGIGPDDLAAAYYDKSLANVARIAGKVKDYGVK